MSDSTQSPNELPAALTALFDETVALFHRLRVAAEQVHGQGELSAGRRGLLRELSRLGPRTVPTMARARPVSRQHIQVLVNQLLTEGLVELVENPAHRRSRLVGLTPKGQRVVDTMNRREAVLYGRLQVAIRPEDFRGAATVLKTARQVLESGEWQRLIASSASEEA